MKVLAIDPGGTTGMAEYVYGNFHSYEVKDGLEGFAECWLPYIKGGFDRIVIEKFTISAATIKKTRQYDALEIIGLVKATGHVHGPEVKLQTPAQAKGFATDDKLKALGWWDSSPGGHKNDATRHLVTYLAGNDNSFLMHLAEKMGL